MEISLCCDYSWKHEGQQLLLGGGMGSLIQGTPTIPLFLSAMINQAPQRSPSIFSILVLPLSLLRNLRCEETESPQVTATDFGVPVSDTAYAICDLLQSQARPKVLVNKCTHCVSLLTCTGAHSLLQSGQCRLEGVSQGPTSHLKQGYHKN